MHPVAWDAHVQHILLINVGYFSPFSLIECPFEKLRILPSVFVENMRILVSNHLCLEMTGIALHRLDVTTIQLELIGNARVTQTVKHHRRKVIIGDEVFHRFPDAG